MTAPADTAETAEPVRERGRWAPLLIALLAFLLVPRIPLLRTIVPVEQTSALLVAGLAVCTLLGWRSGGRVMLAVVWLLLAVWTFARPLQAPIAADLGYDRLARGWALLLAAAFGLVCVVTTGKQLFPRALMAVALAIAVAIPLALGGRGGAARTERTVGRELEARHTDFLAAWDKFRGEPDMKRLTAQNGEVSTMFEMLDARYRSVPAIVARLFPALLALESLAALALAWSVFHRVSRMRIGDALSPLRSFRFSDQLVWGLILGITLMVVPNLSALRGVGLNLLVFFGALYAIRGAAVVAWFLAPGIATTIVIALLALVFGPLLAIGALGVGLGDTWVDWRSHRPRPAT